MKVGDWCIVKTISGSLTTGSVCRVRSINMSLDSPYRIDVQTITGEWLGFYTTKEFLTPITKEVADIMIIRSE